MTTLTCTRTACLRSFNPTPRTIPSPVKATVAFFSTARPTEQRANHNKRPSITAELANAQRTRPSSRYASSIPTSSRPATFKVSTTHTSKPALRHASSTSTSPSTQEPDENILTWNRFFDLRRKRRWINVGCSVVTAVGAVGIFTPILAQQDLDSWGAQISGLDPIVVLGISTFAVAAGGWLCGPSFGTAMFSLWAGRRGWNKLIAEKEKSFYARIKRYRADASASSPQNPIPDYYGEKIASVKDYRRWLKDQKAFNLKKNKNML